MPCNEAQARCNAHFRGRNRDAAVADIVTSGDATGSDLGRQRRVRRCKLLHRRIERTHDLDSGIADQDVDAAEGPDNRGDPGVHVALARDIHRHAHRAAARRL